jgi:hypothetical protein
LADKDRIGFLTITEDPVLHFYLVPPISVDKFILPLLKADASSQEEKGSGPVVAWGVMARS